MSKRHGNRRGGAPRGTGNVRPGASARTRDAGARTKARDVFVPRPFAGLVDEPEWVALRELVPAATAPLKLNAELAARYADPDILVATVLPMAMPAVVRSDGQVILGLQRQLRSGDISRDLGVALAAALETEPGGTVEVPALATEGPRLQDLVADGPLEVTLHDSFRFWLDGDAADDPGVAASLERADAAIHPTTRLSGARAAYWFRMPDRTHLRWVLPDAESDAMDALARLAADEAIGLGDGTRFAGTFRAHGLLIPVWDLPGDQPAEHWEAPVDEFGRRYASALADTGPLTAAQRRARAGLLGRQFTLR